MAKLYFISIGAGIVIIFLLAITDFSSKPQTSYQKCVAVSKQLRSDEDATNYRRTFCDILDYEPGDLR